MTFDFNFPIEEEKATSELKDVVGFMSENVLKMYPSNRVTPYHFMLSVMEYDDCAAYKVLSRNMLDETMTDLKVQLHDKLSSSSQNVIGRVSLDKMLAQCFKEGPSSVGIDCEDCKVNSAQVMAAVLLRERHIGKAFSNANVDIDSIKESVKAESEAMEEMEHAKEEKKEGAGNGKGKESGKKESGKGGGAKERNKPAERKRKEKEGGRQDGVEEPKRKGLFRPDLGIGERGYVAFLENLNKVCESDGIRKVIGNDGIMDAAFNVLTKMERNNVVIIGENGVGKTATVESMAARIVEDDVPFIMTGKTIYKMNVQEVVEGLPMRAQVLNTIQQPIEDINASTNCIFFIDDVHLYLDSKGRYYDYDTIGLIEWMARQEDISMICTATPKGYSSYIESNPVLAKRFEPIRMETPTAERAVEIIKAAKSEYESFHGVKYTNSAISDCVRLAERNGGKAQLPMSALDLMDNVGAKVGMKRKSEMISEAVILDMKLQDVREKKKECRNGKSDEDMDSLVAEEIRLKDEIRKCRKRDKKPLPSALVTSSDIRKAVSESTGIPMSDLDKNELKRLRGLSDALKKEVIGQDKAVDEVCRVVKRQRVGLADPTKPSVLFFGGSTGTGKSYLAKKLAEKVFGQNHFIKLDMSEYADKASVNKLYGSSAGYIGYDDGGVLTEAVKKNKYCVLLLDEIEKACTPVHDVFLQLFDEGRLTDNKGVMVDFRNVVVIMTSNVGASEVAERGGGIGFTKDGSSFSESIIEKNLKKSFKPEFLNRIDKIVYFNNLSDDNLKEIIRLEILKAKDKVASIGYGIDEPAIGEEMTRSLLATVKKEKGFGARPVVRAVRTAIIDKVTDLVIDGKFKKGHSFTAAELGM